MSVTDMLVKQISIFELVSICFSALGGVATLIAAGFALFQWHQSTKLKRAELIKEALEKIRDDEEFAKVLYEIDYGEDSWYNDGFHDNHELEAQFDRVFAYFDYLCYIRKRKLISRKDFKIFEYRIVRMATNTDVQKYLFNLYHFSKANSTYCSFSHLIEYMIKNRLLPDEFKHRDSGIYEKILNY